MKHPAHTRHKALMLAALALTALGATAWRLQCVQCIDDIAYAYVVPDEGNFMMYACLGRKVATLADVMESISHHWMVCNGRLANFLYIFAQLLPWSVLQCVNGLAVTALLWLIMHLGIVRLADCRPVAVVAAVASMWALLPWSDGMRSSDFVANYVWSSVMALAYVSLYGRSGGPRRLALSVPVAFAAGWMHESFGVPLLAYSFVAGLLNWNDADSRSRRYMAILTAALAAGTLVGFSPGSIDRASGVVSLARRSNTFGVITGLFPTLLAATAYILTRRHTAKAGRRTTLALLAMALTSVAIAYVANLAGRALWCADICACVIITRSFQNARLRCGRICEAAAWTAMAAYAVWLAMLTVWQHRANEVYTHCVDELTTRMRPIVYADTHYAAEAPAVLAGITNCSDLMDFGNQTFTVSALTHGQFHHIAVLPESCRYKDFDRWPGIAGHNDLRGRRPFLLSGRAYDTDSTLFTLTFDGVRRPSVALKAIRIPIPDENNRMLYLYTFPLGRRYKGLQLMSVDISCAVDADSASLSRETTRCYSYGLPPRSSR